MSKLNDNRASTNTLCSFCLKEQQTSKNPFAPRYII